ncbi:MAG: hypothetical protein AAFQ45_01125 [Pseudomonadota bacterium]
MRLRCLVIAAALVGMALPAAAGTSLPAIRMSPSNAIPACVTPERLMAFLRKRNPRLSSRYLDVANEYAIIGRAYGVRWDFAFFQMIVETNSLLYQRVRNGGPSNVRPGQNNFAGLGAIAPGEAGEAFPDVTTGIQAHLEHVLMYSGRPIANPVAERTRKVQQWRVLDEWRDRIKRPVTFHDLGLRWAPLNAGYVETIEAVARRFYSEHCPETDWSTVIAQPEPAGQRMIMASAWVSGGEQATPTRVRRADRPAAVKPPKPRLAKRPRDRVAKDRPRLPLDQRREIRRPRIASLAPPVLPRRAPARPALTRTAKPKTLPELQRAQRQRPAKPARTKPPKLRAVVKPKARPVRPKTPKPKSADDKVRELVGNRLVQLRTDMGAVIPVKFRDNGTMSGSAGNLAFFLGAARDRGKWWVKSGMLCKRWKVWLDSKTMCLKLKRRGRTVHWRSRDGRSGTAKIIR